VNSLQARTEGDEAQSISNEGEESLMDLIAGYSQQTAKKEDSASAPEEKAKSAKAKGGKK
jgi:hypothetical protein